MERWRAASGRLGGRCGRGLGRRLDRSPGRRLLGLVLAVAWALAAPLAAAGQGAWAPAGPDGRVVTGLAAHPGSRSPLYPSTQPWGVFKSTARAPPWAPARPPLAPPRLPT